MSAVERILSAANLFARLELAVELVDVATVRSHYRRLALAVHPDKCSAPLAYASSTSLRLNV